MGCKNSKKNSKCESYILSSNEFKLYRPAACRQLYIDPGAYAGVLGVQTSPLATFFFFFFFFAGLPVREVGQARMPLSPYTTRCLYMTQLF